MTNEKKIPDYSIADLALGKLPPEEALRMLEAIERDPEASKELDIQAELVNLASSEGKEIFEPARSLRPSLLQKMWSEGVAFRTFPRGLLVPLGALATVAVLWVGLSVVSSLTRPPYDGLAQIARSDLEFRTRGDMRDELALVPALCSEGRFDDVVRLSERFVRAYPASDLAGFAHYSAGLGYLASARRSTLGFFPSYDRARVEKALNHLTWVAGDTTRNPLAEDALWLKAKGFLMVEDTGAARAALSRLLAMDGRRGEEVRELIRGINISGSRP
jgi:hypothetical protein